MRKLAALTLLFLMLVLAAACAPADDGIVKPPDIRYGEDICEVCGMIISEARFAAACITTDDEGHTFDGIGEMLIFLDEQPESDIKQCFVHDYETADWIIAEDAYYLDGDELHTPMGWGIVAFSTQEQADLLLEEVGGDVYLWTELQD